MNHGARTRCREALLRGCCILGLGPEPSRARVCVCVSVHADAADKAPEGQEHSPTGLTWAPGSRQTDTIAGSDTDDAAAGRNQALPINRNGLESSGGHSRQERTRTVTSSGRVSAARSSFWEGWARGRLLVALIQPHLRAGHCAHQTRAPLFSRRNTRRNARQRLFPCSVGRQQSMKGPRGRRRRMSEGPQRRGPGTPLGPAWSARLTVCVSAPSNFPVFYGSCSVAKSCDSLRCRGLQHARLPCPPTPAVCSTRVH